MAERKKTPDILADLLGDKSQETIETAKQEAVLPAKQQNSSRQDVLPVKLQSGKAGGISSTETMDIAASSVHASDEDSEENESGAENGLSSKLKVTFYLSEESVDLLEDAQRQLRRMNRGAGKTQSKAATSKSALLEEALKIACADLEAKGPESQLARILF